MEAAATLFLSQGVMATSMDNVAKASGVSKQTVYSHFESKDLLYTAVIEHKCSEYHLDPALICQALSENATLQDVLMHIGVQFIRLLQDEDVIAMYRIVISEAKNSPDVARLFYDVGPRASLAALSALFRKISDNVLSDTQASQLALHYFSMLKGEIHIRNLLGLQKRLDDDDIIGWVSNVVTRTLILYNAELTG